MRTNINADEPLSLDDVKKLNTEFQMKSFDELAKARDEEEKKRDEEFRGYLKKVSSSGTMLSNLFDKMAENQKEQNKKDLEREKKEAIAKAISEIEERYKREGRAEDEKRNALKDMLANGLVPEDLRIE